MGSETNMTIDCASPLPVVVSNSVCTQCGCVCDDIGIVIENGRITAANNACDKGREWFLGNHEEGDEFAFVEGKPAPLTEAIDRAAQILLKARYPLIFGLSDTPCEAQRQAVALADRVGACLDTTTSISHGAFGMAFQEVGEVTCSLGEVKNRADLVVFWGTDPATTHPRHGERYSLEAKGLFTPNGRSDRFVVVVDVEETATAKKADLFLQIKKGSDFEALWGLRALVKGLATRDDIGAQTGIPLEVLKALAERMKSCHFGILFFGPGLSASRGRHMNAEAALGLVKDLNDYTRFYAKPMTGPGNVTGADNVVCWQTGYPLGVHFGQGFPRFNPGEFTALDVLGRGEADAVMLVAIDPAEHLPDSARKYLGSVPSIHLSDNPKAEGNDRATVLFLTATYGIRAAGTVYRMDDVSLPLRPVLATKRPTDEEVLVAIERRVHALQVESGMKPSSSSKRAR